MTNAQMIEWRNEDLAVEWFSIIAHWFGPSAI